MAITALRLITNALRGLGVVASGESLDADQAADGLESLNELIEIWRLDSLMVYAITRSIQSTTAGQATYTIGTGGVWNIPRPVRIESAYHRQSSDGLELPMRILTEQEYRGITVRSTESTWPLWIYFDYAYPLSTATLYPVPSINNQVVLYPWTVLSSVASLATSIDLLPGYQAALRFNLQVYLASEYGVSVSPEVATLAVSTKGAIQTINYRPQLMHVDPALVRSGYNWNIVTDGEN